MRYAVFDIETRVNKELLKSVFFAGQGLDKEEAYIRFRADLIKRQGDDFPPLVLHVPISIALGDVSADHVLRKVESLAVDNYSEAELVREFWRRLESFNGCLVSFNGRQFDLPVLELQALRYGLRCPVHFSESGRRRRYATSRHLDLFDFLSNYGVFRLRGGINALLQMIGLPGKEAMDGSRVQQAYEAGQMDKIHRYCRRDVVQTYFLFLRVQLLRGEITEDQYAAAKQASSVLLEGALECEADPSSQAFIGATDEIRSLPERPDGAAVKEAAEESAHGSSCGGADAEKTDAAFKPNMSVAAKD
jgi:predicted PolB exonuclease-like 3'-5' exonuclease